MANRRLFITLLLLGLAGPGMAPAFAKEDDGGKGGGDNSGPGGGDDGGKDDDNDGGGKDDDRDDDRDDDKDDDRDDDKDDDKAEDRQGEDDDRDKIRQAVRTGKAESLGSILPAVRRRYPGKVVRIRLTGSGARLIYRIRLINAENKLIEVRVNAQSGKIMGASSI